MAIGRMAVSSIVTSTPMTRVYQAPTNVSALAHRTPLSELVDRVDLIRSIMAAHL